MTVFVSRTKAKLNRNLMFFSTKTIQYFVISEWNEFNFKSLIRFLMAKLLQNIIGTASCYAYLYC